MAHVPDDPVRVDNMEIRTSTEASPWPAFAMLSRDDYADIVEGYADHAGVNYSLYSFIDKGTGNRYYYAEVADDSGVIITTSAHVDYSEARKEMDTRINYMKEFGDYDRSDQ